MNEDMLARLRRVRLLVTDLDGVLTDGRVYYGDAGDTLKAFHMHDGFGLVLLRRGGIPTVIISGRRSKVNRRRARELKVLKIVENVDDKGRVYRRILEKYGFEPEQTCYIGDDVIDLPVLRKAGLAVAVQNAVPEVIEAAHYVTEKPGGEGAVREVVDLILKAQGKWPIAVGRYLHDE